MWVVEPLPLHCKWGGDVEVWVWYFFVLFFFSKNLMAVMYKIVEGDSPRLPDHFHPQLRALFTRSIRSREYFI